MAKTPKAPEARQVPYPHCRSLGHSWGVGYYGPADSAPVPMPQAHVYRHWWLVLVAVCSSCGLRRIDYFIDRAYGTRVNDPYRVAHRRYEYPEDYKVQGDPVSRSEARQALHTLFRPSEGGGK